MQFIQQLLNEMDNVRQAEIEAQHDLANSGVENTKDPKNAAVLRKKAKEKQQQLKNLSSSEDPIDRQIAALRKQIANLLAKKQAKSEAAARQSANV